MNSGLWIFPGGVALGLVAGLLVGQAGSENPDPGEPGEVAEAPVRIRPEDDELRGRRGPHRHPRRHPILRLSSGDPRADLEELLTTLSTLKNEDELNITDLIRRASLLTMLREDEALDVLGMLAGRAGETGRSDDFVELASAVVFARLCELNGPGAMDLLYDARYAPLWENDREELAAIGMNSWVAADPEGARLWFDGALDQVEKWQPGDPEAAPSTALRLLQSDDFRAASMNGLASQDPLAMEERLAAIPDKHAREELQDDLYRSLVRNESSTEGLTALLDRCADLPEARREAVAKLDSIDPHAAAAWVEKQEVDPLRDNDVTGVADALMKQDLDAGIDWYMSQEFSDPARHSDRMSRIVSRLANEDPERAAAWLVQQPDNATRDPAEVSMAWSAMNRRDWSDSLEWLSRVSSEKLRQDNLNTVLARGWDREQKALRPEVVAAAEAAGFGEQAREYRGN